MAVDPAGMQKGRENRALFACGEPAGLSVRLFNCRPAGRGLGVHVPDHFFDYRKRFFQLFGDAGRALSLPELSGNQFLQEETAAFLQPGFTAFLQPGFTALLQPFCVFFLSDQIRRNSRFSSYSNRLTAIASARFFSRKSRRIPSSIHSLTARSTALERMVSPA